MESANPYDQPQQQQMPAAYPHLPGYSAVQPDQYAFQMLTQMSTTNQFNAFCIDCQKNKSTHANVTLGTFICAECADFISKNFTPMQAYIKPLLTEPWDHYQLSCMALGGNQKFYEYLVPYKKEKLGILEKNKTSAALYYARKLCADVRVQKFTEIAPAKDSNEELERAQAKAREGVNRAGVEMTKAGNNVKASWNKYILGKKPAEE